MLCVGVDVTAWLLARASAPISIKGVIVNSTFFSMASFALSSLIEQFSKPTLPRMCNPFSCVMLNLPRVASQSNTSSISSRRKPTVKTARTFAKCALDAGTLKRARVYSASPNTPPVFSTFLYSYFYASRAISPLQTHSASQFLLLHCDSYRRITSRWLLSRHHDRFFAYDNLHVEQRVLFLLLISTILLSMSTRRFAHTLTKIVVFDVVVV